MFGTFYKIFGGIKRLKAAMRMFAIDIAKTYNS
jgi:hypothetical protein